MTEANESKETMEMAMVARKQLALQRMDVRFVARNATLSKVHVLTTRIENESKELRRVF